MELSHLRTIRIPAVTRLAATLCRGAPLSSAALNFQLASLPSHDTGHNELPQSGARALASTPSPPKEEGGQPKAHLTDPVFFTNTYLFSLAGAQLLEASIGAQAAGAQDGGVKLSIVLDRSVFHPQGGGQPADTGCLRGDELPELQVAFVSARKDDGAIVHDCVTTPEDAALWVQAATSKRAPAVSCHVDEARRRLCARLHSAGHLLDAAVRLVDVRWVPGKGYHFPDGPYVEYVLTEESRKIDTKKPGDKEAILAQIQENMNQLIAAGGKVGLRYDDTGVRHVSMAGEECPCGGTHVDDVSEIGKVVVKKLQNKQGNVRLSYTLEAASGA